MSLNKAVHKLNTDLSHLHHAQAAEAHAKTAAKKAATTEKNTRSQIAAQEQKIYDQFESGSLTPDQQSAALNQLYALGQKDQKAIDAFHTASSKAKGELTQAKHAYTKARHQALKDLKPAEYHLSLKQTNKDRKALGLKALKHAVRPAGKGSDAIKAARSVLGRNIQDLKFHGPLAQYLDKWPSSHVCCANFVSACLQKAGLIQHSEHNDNVSGLAGNLARDKNWNRVGSSHLQPGDVVCFEVPGEGHMAHVEMFAGYHNGSPIFIGSNNVNPDGSQRISEGHVGYHIDQVYRYHG